MRSRGLANASRASATVVVPGTVRGSRSITSATSGPASATGTLRVGIVPEKSTDARDSRFRWTRARASGSVRAMPSWSDFETAAPELAADVRARLEAHKHKTIATLRRDGSPRISGTEATFADGELWIGSMWQARKALDLQSRPAFRAPQRLRRAGRTGPVTRSSPAWSRRSPTGRRACASEQRRGGRERPVAPLPARPARGLDGLAQPRAEQADHPLVDAGTRRPHARARLTAGCRPLCSQPGRVASPR